MLQLYNMSSCMVGLTMAGVMASTTEGVEMQVLFNFFQSHGALIVFILRHLLSILVNYSLLKTSFSLNQTDACTAIPNR